MVNLVKQWQKHLPVLILGAKETINIFEHHHLCPQFISSDKFNYQNYPSILNLIRHEVRRTFLGTVTLFKHRHQLSKFSHVYSASDFYPDFLPAFLAKIFHPRIKWIAAFYLKAPNPFDRQSPYHQNQQFLKGLFFYISQLLPQILIKHYADYVFLTSQPDIKLFPHKAVFVIQSGVDITASKKYLSSAKIIPLEKRPYHAVFIGRLHPQKGVLELVDIWHLLCQKIPQAKLAIIGIGQLEKPLKQKIIKHQLSNNIKMLGFLDGAKKYHIFKNSRLVVHPATYDSGGMAAAEAMAWGLPGVSFDLESLKTYYPEGMVKTPCFDFNQFAENIYQLLTKPKLYQSLSSKAIKLIETKWAWSTKLSEIFNTIFQT